MIGARDRDQLDPAGWRGADEGMGGAGRTVRIIAGGDQEGRAGEPVQRRSYRAVGVGRQPSSALPPEPPAADGAVAKPDGAREPAGRAGLGTLLTG
jgi:hypothetical protein